MILIWLILQGDSALQKVKWLRVVLDEGHAIRNPNAQQTKAIYALQAERKWVLTGKTMCRPRGIIKISHKKDLSLAVFFN
jgi:SNF2 family DNA or RNA helicase